MTPTVHGPLGLPAGAQVNILRHVPEEQMTTRARLYLLGCSVQHFAVSIIAFFAAHIYEGTRWAAGISVIPLTVWAAMFAFGGLHFAYAAIRAAEHPARAALIMSTGISTSWAFGFSLASFDGGSSSALYGVLFFTLAWKDLVMCRMPLRSPFESVVRKYAPDEDG